METSKKQILNHFFKFVSVQQCCLKNNNRNFKKSFWIFWVPEQLQYKLFQADLDKPWIDQWYMVLLWKGTSAPVAPFWKGIGQRPRHASGVPVHVYKHSLYSLQATMRHSNEHNISSLLRQGSS